MMKIVASLVILGLCANVAFGLAPTSSSNSGAFSASLLNSTAYTILSGANSTDTVNWDPSVAASTGVSATNIGVYNGYTWFGPGATNDTSYLYGIPSTGYTSATATGSNTGAATPTITSLTSLRKRVINNTIVAWANDTKEYAVVSDTTISTSITATNIAAATGPGVIGLLTSGYDSATAAQVNEQVWFTLISGTSGSVLSTTKLTSITDIVSATQSATAGCTATSFTLGNVWYDIGAEAFFYTYAKLVQTQTGAAANAACAGSTGATYASTVYLGGTFINGTTQYFTTPISATASSTAATGVSSIVGGGDNWLNATNIYIVYRDTSNTAVYSSKTTKATTTSALGSFSSLIKDPTTTTGPPAISATYTPISIWASNFTYAITIGNHTTSTPSTGSASDYYNYINFYNGSSTGVDSGLSSSTASDFGYYAGWQLNTGYTVVASWQSGTTSPVPTTYTMATYYGNGTANMTSTTLGSTTYASPAQFYEDVNGTMWIGWTDVDYANSDYTYSAYLAKFQGQLNVPSGASILSAISAFFALFLAAIFVF